MLASDEKPARQVAGSDDLMLKRQSREDRGKKECGGLPIWSNRHHRVILLRRERTALTADLPSITD